MLLKKHLKQTFLLLITALAIHACMPADKKDANDINRRLAPVSGESGPISESALMATGKYRLKYDLGAAAIELRLSRELKEVSGLSMSSDGAYLLAVNDEQGKVYYLDKESGRIQKELSFGSPGDYEGLEMVGGKLFIARSDGVLFEMEASGKEGSVARPHYTLLNADYDVEGLAYDHANHRLLLACKGKAGEGKAFENKRAIYGFSLDSLQLSKEPVYLLSEEMAVAEEAIREAWWTDVLKGHFSPSAIAVHPITGHIYIVSSKGKARSVLVMAPSGELLSIRELDKDPFNQPEGICFEKDGTMYISTEAKGKRGKGRIYRFRML